MGCYINPIEGTKEQFLKNYGTLLPMPIAAMVPSGYVPVCWVDNGGFTAAGVAFDEREMQEFIADFSNRPHIWYICPVDKVAQVSILLGDNRYHERFKQGPFSQS